MIGPGMIVAGKFRVDRVLGQGGMGVVLAATHITLGQPVALKFLLPEHAAVPMIHDRFLREARAAARLRGEHVCRVSDVGTLEDGSPYIVMELLHGSDLANLRGDGLMPVQTAVDLVLQACMGVAEAHSLGIVHRDLKPANLFVTRRTDGSQLVKVVDFGIAKAPEEMSVALTTTSMLLGSPGYMSPEQMRSTRAVDARTDIWSLGVILYELVSGRLPFNSNTVTHLAILIATEPTPRLGIGVPPGFEAVVARCLEKSPELRFHDLAALADALVPFGGPGARELANGVAHVLAASSRPRPPTHQPVGYQASTTLASAVGAAPSLPGRKRSSLGVVLAAAVAVAVGVAITIAAVGARETPLPAATPPPTQQPMLVEVPPDAAPADAAQIVILDAAVVAPDAVELTVPTEPPPHDEPKKKRKKVPKPTEPAGEPDYGAVRR